ncbi:portal protein [Microbacterium phage Pickles13]|nr:portal protein [Microbacterium phage Pickles13]
MGLPENKAAWPPASETGRYGRMAVNSVWYGGDPTALADLYQDGSAGEKYRSGIRYFVERIASWFWASSDPSAPDDKVHLPVAQDIATMSSEVLFGEEVRFEVQPDPTWEPNDDGEYTDEQQRLIEQTQKRLDELLDGMDFQSTLLAAAETAAPLGSVGLRMAWDKRLGMDQPVISRVDADHTVAEYEFGMLKAVTFWEIVSRENGSETLVYHLERHEPGRVLHGLYRGTRGNLGMAIPLTEHSSTAPYAELVDEEGAIATGVPGLLAESIPNMLPDPLDRGSEAGRSDFTPGVLSLFDSIDRTVTSLMRDIADGRSRLLIADYMMQGRGIGKGVEFAEDQHLFVRLKREPGETGDAPIDQVQFKIRVEEHLATIDFLTRKAIESCGYNVDSDTGEAGEPMTATEYSGRAKKTARTRDKKLRYWRRIERMLRTLLEVDAAIFMSGVTPLPVKMIVPDMMQPTTLELANTAKVLREAKAASTRVIVEMMGLVGADRIDEEIAEIEGAEADPTTVGLPGAPDQPGAPLPDAPDDDEDAVEV